MLQVRVHLPQLRPYAAKYFKKAAAVTGQVCCTRAGLLLPSFVCMGPALSTLPVPTTPYCSSCYPGPLDSFVLLIWYLRPFEFTTSAPEANDDPWRQRTEALVPAVLEGEPRQAANVIISCEARQGQKIIISNLRLMKLRLRKDKSQNHGNKASKKGEPGFKSWVIWFQTLYFVRTTPLRAC